MASRKNHNKPIALWIALTVSAVMLAAGIGLLDDVGIRTVGRKLILPLGRLMVFITIGLVAGQAIEAAGWTHTLGRLGAPLFRFARLGSRCSAAFSTAFISGTAANAMLYDFWKDEKISRSQLIMTNLANQLPAFFLHLPTTVFIVLPLTGWAGGLYFLLTFAAALLRFVLILLWGHWHPSATREATGEADKELQKKNGRMAIWAAIKSKLPRRLTSVATYVIPIYIAAFLLNSAGMFDWMRQWAVHWTAVTVVPVEALSLVVLSFAAEFTSGFAAAGALMQEGVITIKQAVLALLIGNVTAFPIRALRHQLPRLMGIFAPKLGLQILLLGQGVRIVSLVVVGTFFYWIV